MWGQINVLIANENTTKPSFDCKSKLSSIEKLICNDSKLSELDLELGSLYKRVVKDKAAIKSQRNWLKDRNIKCINAKNKINCIANAYINRIRILKRWVPEITNCVAVFKSKSITSYHFDSENKKFEIISKVKGPFRCVLVGFNTDKNGLKRFLCEGEYWYDMADIDSFNQSKCILSDY